MVNLPHLPGFRRIYIEAEIGRYLKLLDETEKLLDNLHKELGVSEKEITRLVMAEARKRRKKGGKTG